MYQRAAKMKKRSMDGYTEMQVFEFFKRAQETLERVGEKDAAFYMEQVHDHLRQGGRLSESTSKIFGL